MARSNRAEDSDPAAPGDGSPAISTEVRLARRDAALKPVGSQAQVIAARASPGAAAQPLSRAAVQERLRKERTRWPAEPVLLRQERATAWQTVTGLGTVTGPQERQRGMRASAAPPHWTAAGCTYG